MPDATSLPATCQTACMDLNADSPNRATKSDAVAEQEVQLGIATESTATHAWRTKENRSPNLSLLQQLQTDLGVVVESQEVADQVTHTTSTLLFQNCEYSSKGVCCSIADMHGIPLNCGP